MVEKVKKQTLKHMLFLTKNDLICIGIQRQLRRKEAVLMAGYGDNYDY